ncbi:PREDICTED: RNA-directed DNA polymerase from mobile element jockey-like [Acropora digitifera]|uniref:RNA-directed DNA polymerase from mobile element jockey-like n=1 Tax=Acropora digitifera TaxID=70779 RepID=UPI00077B1D74|nr:PREDICTED: RNA-directed DNA polymerase from mobile element jockey-like [Acropora digitifera]
MRTDCSTGCDQIPSKYLKLSADVISSPLTHILDCFINTNTFPANWKTARVSPIPKVDFPTESDHYRPIAILPVLSKVYERLVLSQLLEYVELEGLFQGTTSGYRKGHSTSTVLLRIQDDIIQAMKKGELTLIAFADFSKAFDYFIVISKLHAIRRSKSALLWILSYLSNRQQFVQANDKQSHLKDVLFGVPQGSVLGPVIFNLYANDLPDCLKDGSTCFQYADDTTVLLHAPLKELKDCVNRMNNILQSIESWAADSNLLLNETKTKQMLVTTRQMSEVHDLGDYTPPLSLKNKLVDR